MAVISWGKPKIEICKYENGVMPANPVWKAVPTPKEDSTQLTTTKGDVVEAKEEGGAVVDKKTKKSTYSLAFELYVKRGFVPPAEDEDGVVVDNYAIRLTPEDATLEGLLFDKAAVSAEEKYTSADGKTKVYTFDALVPDDGSKQSKPYFAMGLHVTPASLRFSSAADNTGKTVAATATGTVTANSDQSWATTTVSGTTVTVKVSANSTGSQRTANVTVSADGKQSIVPVTQEA